MNEDYYINNPLEQYDMVTQSYESLIREILIDFMDNLREYVHESGTNIAYDERDSSEFVDIFLNEHK